MGKNDSTPEIGSTQSVPENSNLLGDTHPGAAVDVLRQVTSVSDPATRASARVSLATEILAQHNEALARWNQIVLLQKQVPFGGIPIIGATLRALLRLIVLGKITWGQSRLNDIALYEARVYVDCISNGISNEDLGRTDAQVAELAESAASLQRQIAELEKWTETAQAQVAALDKWTVMARAQLAALETAISSEQGRLNYSDTLLARWHRVELIALDTIYRRIGTQYGFTVQTGPLKGMCYLSQLTGDSLWVGSAKVPKLVGAYESELHDVVREIVKSEHDIVVNVGCGEGYYAVGFAMALPHARVYAFDSDVQSQRWTEEVARLNNVQDRITVAGECTVNDLRPLITKPCLLFVDCEGCELDLLQPDLLPQLTQCDVLVELHDFINPTISSCIQERFASTHTIAIVDSVARDPDDYPVLQEFPPIEQALAIEEFRPGDMKWAWMKSKSTHRTNSAR